MKSLLADRPPYRTRCACGWPLDDWNECGSCRVRKQAKLPAHARCETCLFRTTVRCCNLGPHAVCTAWAEMPETLAECPTCSGPLVYLGALGKMHHFRCRDCGADCHD